MLHTIATGNMTPSYTVTPEKEIRPVFLYTVDADEFVVNKLLDRGSLSATTIVTNVQDFIMLTVKGLGIPVKLFLTLNRLCDKFLIVYKETYECLPPG